MTNIHLSDTPVTDEIIMHPDGSNRGAKSGRNFDETVEVIVEPNDDD